MDTKFLERLQVEETAYCWKDINNIVSVCLKEVYQLKYTFFVSLEWFGHNAKDI